MASARSCGSASRSMAKGRMHTATRGSFKRTAAVIAHIPQCPLRPLWCGQVLLSARSRDGSRGNPVAPRVSDPGRYNPILVAMATTRGGPGDGTGNGAALDQRNWGKTASPPVIPVPRQYGCHRCRHRCVRRRAEQGAPRRQTAVAANRSMCWPGHRSSR